MHTPGPWVAEEDVVYAAGDCDIHAVADCSCNRTCRSEEETVANAHLIAAAPELLEALEENLTTLEWTRERLLFLKASAHEIEMAIKGTKEILARAEGK